MKIIDGICLSMSELLQEKDCNRYIIT